MERLKVLEEKIVQLVDVIKSLKAAKASLVKENVKLQKKVGSLELSVLSDKKKIDQEKELTKEVVDELIKSIDTLVGSEEQL